MRFFISKYDHGKLSAKYNGEEQPLFEAKPVLTELEALSRKLTNELKKKIELRKVYIGIKVISNGETLDVLPSGMEANPKELKRAIRRELFNRRTEAEDQRKAWELIYEPFVAEVNEDKDKEILKHFKKKKKSNRKQYSRRTRRRHMIIERSSLYGHVEVDRIYNESACRRMNGEPVNVDHKIALMGIDDQGEWIISGLTVPSNLEIVSQKYNNIKASYVDLEEVNNELNSEHNLAIINRNLRAK